MKRFILCVAPKGGVGKSAVAQAFTGLARRARRSVSAWDLDRGTGRLAWFFRDRNPVAGVGIEDIRDPKAPGAWLDAVWSGADDVLLDVPGGALDHLVGSLEGGAGRRSWPRYDGFNLQQLGRDLDAASAGVLYWQFLCAVRHDAVVMVEDALEGVFYRRRRGAGVVARIVELDCETHPLNADKRPPRLRDRSSAQGRKSDALLERDSLRRDVKAPPFAARIHRVFANGIANGETHNGERRCELRVHSVSSKHSEHTQSSGWKWVVYSGSPGAAALIAMPRQ